MNRWTKSALGMGTAMLLGSCAEGNSYPAPFGANLIVQPGEITLTLRPTVILMEALVQDPDRGEDGMMLNNVEVTVKSYVPDGFILIPEFAITAYNNEDFCTDSNENGIDDCTEQAEYYYQWSGVDTGGVNADFLRTSTDSHGVARVYIYARCFQTNCVVDGVALNTCELASQPEEIQTACYEEGELTDSTVVFSIGVDSETVTFTAEEGG